MRPCTSSPISSCCCLMVARMDASGLGISPSVTIRMSAWVWWGVGGGQEGVRGAADMTRWIGVLCGSGWVGGVGSDGAAGAAWHKGGIDCCCCCCHTWTNHNPTEEQGTSNRSSQNQAAQPPHTWNHCVPTTFHAQARTGELTQISSFTTMILLLLLDLNVGTSAAPQSHAPTRTAPPSPTPLQPFQTDKRSVKNCKPSPAPTRAAPGAPGTASGARQRPCPRRRSATENRAACRASRGRPSAPAPAPRL